MPTTGHGARLKRIRAECDVLALTDARIAEVGQAELAAKVALAAAQADLDAAIAELDVLDARKRSLHANVDELRAQHRRELWMDRIPLDVLQCVFDETVRGKKPWDDFGQGGGHNCERASAPFLLATIYSRWRKLALTMPRLWTYVSFPAFEDIGDLSLQNRIASNSIKLSRSRSAPLDVCCPFEDYPADTHAKLISFLQRVTAQSSRLGAFELWVPSGIDREPTLDAFKAPTPSLTHLCIIVTPDTWEADHSDMYLPYAPRLECLELQRTGMSCCPLVTIFQSLTAMKLWTGCTIDEFIVLGKAATVTLQHLLLAEVWDVIPTTGTPITFPALSSLTLLDSLTNLHNLIVAPRLTSLTLRAHLCDTTLISVLDHFSESVTTLTLFGQELPEDALAVLPALRNVETLACTNRYDDPMSTLDQFFSQMATASPAVWPKLRAIQLAGTDAGKDLGKGLLALVRARNLSSAGDSPRKLAQIDLDGSDTPTWLRSTIEHILAKS